MKENPFPFDNKWWFYTRTYHGGRFMTGFVGPHDSYMEAVWELLKHDTRRKDQGEAKAGA